jgi:hypothetical protein
VIENDEYHFSALTKYDHKMTMSEINKVRKPLRLPLHKGAFCFVKRKPPAVLVVPKSFSYA